MDTAKIDEWRLEDCRTFLANCRGRVQDVDGVWMNLGDPPDSGTIEHPIPATLDEAAKLPEGWQTQNVGFHIHGVADPVVSTFATKGDWIATMKNGVEVPGTRAIAHAPNELLSRFRLRCKVESANQRKD